MRPGAIFVLLLMFAGISLAVPLRKRTSVIFSRDNAEMIMEPLFDPDFCEERITLFDDYGIKPSPPQFPPYLLQGLCTSESNVDEEYY